MPSRNPVPRLWLMTDERMGERLWSALTRLPSGSGVIVRHYATPPKARRAVALRVRRIGHARKLVVLIARGTLPGSHGRHGPGRPKGLRTWPAHTRGEALAGIRAGADALFVSPIYPTRSHDGASAIGPRTAQRIARGLGKPIIALGGMNAKRWKNLRGKGYHGYAAIDAWLKDPIKVPL